ncbi:hypothetical protein EDB84DRAFT_1447117 [Lactarius hengduanensis]|nr:hypothetical protein EDB84DRAFT_1447117 [Lactarius hengduanensis]
MSGSWHRGAILSPSQGIAAGLCRAQAIVGRSAAITAFVIKGLGAHECGKVENGNSGLHGAQGLRGIAVVAHASAQRETSQGWLPGSIKFLVRIAKAAHKHQCFDRLLPHWYQLGPAGTSWYQLVQPPKEERQRRGRVGVAVLAAAIGWVVAGPWGSGSRAVRGIVAGVRPSCWSGVAAGAAWRAASASASATGVSHGVVTSWRPHMCRRVAGPGLWRRPDGVWGGGSSCRRGIAPG